MFGSKKKAAANQGGQMPVPPPPPMPPMGMPPQPMPMAGPPMMGAPMPPPPPAPMPQPVAPQVVAPVSSVEEDNTVKVSITLPTNAYFLSGIRDFTLSMTKNMTELGEKWAYRFQSVVDELCNNAIEHGSAKGKDIHISFISHPGECLEIAVQDTGTGPNHYNAAQMKELFVKQKQLVNSSQFLGLRGRGLAKIVGEWTDELLFEDAPDGGLIVRVKKYLVNEKPSDSGGNSGTIPKAV